MPDPQAAQALILVDLQRGLVEGSDAVPNAPEVMRAVLQQLRAARDKGSLIVHVQNHGAVGSVDEAGSAEWELVLVPGDGDVVIGKVDDNAFDGTSLLDVLRSRAVTCLSICGLLSEMCVAATARSALALGFEVVLAHDAHATHPIPGFADEPAVPAGFAARNGGVVAGRPRPHPRAFRGR